MGQRAKNFRGNSVSSPDTYLWNQIYWRAGTHIPLWSERMWSFTQLIIYAASPRVGQRSGFDAPNSPGKAQSEKKKMFWGGIYHQVQGAPLAECLLAVRSTLPESRCKLGNFLGQEDCLTCQRELHRSNQNRNSLKWMNLAGVLKC